MQSTSTHAISTATDAGYTFSIQGQENLLGLIELVASPDEIDQEGSKTILVESFLNEYQKAYLNISPSDIDASLSSWRGDNNSVQNYYEDFFATEFTDFVSAKIDYWVQAKINGKLAGWATFKREKSAVNALYMNLLIVSPEYQSKGIGRQLVFSCLNLPEFNRVDAIHLLLRKKSQGGRTFYKKLGFFADPNYQRAENYVDMELLEGWTWNK